MSDEYMVRVEVIDRLMEFKTYKSGSCSEARVTGFWVIWSPRENALENTVKLRRVGPLCD